MILLTLEEIKILNETANNENMRLVVSEIIWLKYLNRILFEQKLITEAERNNMERKIADKCKNK